MSYRVWARHWCTRGSHFPPATVPQNAGPLTEALSQAIRTVASLHDFTCGLPHAGPPDHGRDAAPHTGCGGVTGAPRLFWHGSGT